MELNRDQIIKALEYCVSAGHCRDCPLFEKRSAVCVDSLLRNAFALIKELTEDNEDLNKTVSSLLETIKDIKADTVRKMKGGE